MKRSNEQKIEVNQMSQSMVEYNILKREAEANKTMYDGLLTKLKRSELSPRIEILEYSSGGSGDGAVHSRPSGEDQEYRAVVLVGLVGGIGLALLREYLDNTVKTPDDIETLVRLPSLAVVPAFAMRQRKWHARQAVGRSFGTNGHEKRIELVAQHLPKSQMSEAFRALRTSLLLSQADHPPQVILVTSALPREGKTTAAANLAVTLAQLGDRTCCWWMLTCANRESGVC